MQYGMLYIHIQGVHGIVSRKSSGYIGWGFIEISFEKNGCMLLNDIWCIFISKCSKCQLVHCFVKTADN